MPQLRSLLDDEILDQARRTLAARLATTQPPERARFDEAMRWIDGGVYGACSVCGCALDPAQVLRAPEQMTCPRCLRTARRAHERWIVPLAFTPEEPEAVSDDEAA